MSCAEWSVSLPVVAGQGCFRFATAKQQQQLVDHGLGHSFSGSKHQPGEQFNLFVVMAALHVWEHPAASSDKLHFLLQVALLEDVDNTAGLHWPWVSRGKLEEGVDKVQAWELDPNRNSNSDLRRAVTAINYGFSGIESAAFGTAGNGDNVLLHAAVDL